MYETRMDARDINLEIFEKLGHHRISLGSLVRPQLSENARTAGDLFYAIARQYRVSQRSKHSASR